MAIRNRARLRALGFAGVTAFLLVGAGQVAAPAAAAAGTPPAGSFAESAEVRVVEVPVQVVRDGQPVRGLTAADFEVWAGKEKQRIVGFEAVDVEALQASPAAAPLVTQLPSGARRHFLFLFDLSQSTPASLSRAQRASLQLVGQLSPADLAGVATFSPARGPRVLLSFTSDRRQVERALRTLGSTELVESRSDWLGLTLGEAKTQEFTLEVRANNPKENHTYVEMMRDLTALEERDAASSARDRARTFARGMSDLAGLLGGVAGRKHVLFLSEGFDDELLLGKQQLVAAETSQEDIPGQSTASVYRTDSEMRFGSTRLQGHLRRMLDEMRRANCAIHSVAIGGLEAGGRDISGSAGDVSMGEVQRTGRGESSLFHLAKETGGTFHRNTNDLTVALAGALHATAVTYLLTIQPDHVVPKGGYVTLRVEVRGAKASEVSARPAFFVGPTPASQAALAERLRIGALVLEGKSGGDLRVAALGVPLLGAGSVSCAVIEVEGESLLTGHVGDMVSAEVSVYAFDRDGTIRAVARQLVAMDLRVVGDRLRGSGFKLFAGLDLPAGDYDLRALVRNTVSGRFGVATARLAVPALGVDGPLAGVFVEPPGRDWLLVRESSSPHPLAYPFTVGERVVVPALTPRLDTGEPVTLWLEAPAGAAGLEGLVRRLDGAVAAASAPLQLGERGLDEGAGRLLATFSAAGLPPGGYTLEVRVAGSSAAASSLPFTVQ